MPAKATATPRAKPTAVREGERVRAFFAVGKRRMRTDRLEYINAKWFSALPTMRKNREGLYLSTNQWRYSGVQGMKARRMSVKGSVMTP